MMSLTGKFTGQSLGVHWTSVSVSRSLRPDSDIDCQYNHRYDVDDVYDVDDHIEFSVNKIITDILLMISQSSLSTHVQPQK